MIGVGLILKGGSERRYSNSFISLFSSGFGHNSAEPHILMVMTFTGRDRVPSETPPEQLVCALARRKASAPHEFLLCTHFPFKHTASLRLVS